MTSEMSEFLSTAITDWIYEDDGRWRHRGGVFEVRRLDFLADVRQFPHQALCDSYVEIYVVTGMGGEPVRVALVTADGGKDVRPIPDHLRYVPSIDLHVARIIATDRERLKQSLLKQASVVAAAYALC